MDFDMSRKRTAAPQPDQSHDDFVSDCISEMLADGDAVDADDAEAQCELIWDEANKEKNMPDTIVRKVSSGKADGLEFVLSDGSIDRVGDIIEPAGWRLQNFRKNPIALFQHDSRFPIGRWADLRIEKNALLGRLDLAPLKTSDRIDEIRRLVQAGILKTVSVGFQGLKSHPREDGRGLVFTESELLECSLVSVPANVNAISVAKRLNVSADTCRLVFAPLRGAVKPAQGAELRLAELAFEDAQRALIGACDRLSELRKADREIAREVEVARHAPGGAAYRTSPPLTDASARLRLLDAKSLGRQLRHARELVEIAKIDLAAAHDEVTRIYKQTR
jgi:HK97 family phage prohead protease